MQFADILIYDEEADKHVHIPFERACKAAGLIDAKDPKDRPDTTGANFPPWCNTEAKTKTAVDANKNGKYLEDICLCIVRPFIEHLMMSAVMTVSGRDTGATLFGPADMYAVRGAGTPPDWKRRTGC